MLKTYIDKYKKTLIYILIILLIPIIIPFIDTIIQIIVTLGRYIGTLLREFIEGVCCCK